MCGISGYIKKVKLTPAELLEASQLNQRLEHRGPDEEGWVTEDNLILGMRRLSIIDVKGADQPFYSTDKLAVCVFNGEIYNYLELRQMLGKKGYRFSSQGDGETLCYLYQEYGIKFVDHLRGMFAIALYDKRQQKLFLIRDRMSEKPIYYYAKPNKFLFSSEMKSIIHCIPQEERTLSPEAVDQFLHYQFITEPTTMLTSVAKVPAASYLELDIRTLNFKVQQYWDMTKVKPIKSSNPADLVEKELLYITDIIGRSDVPVGIALSGGLDSSTIAALVKQHNSNKDITHAFTVGYEGAPVYDERSKARRLAKKLGIKLHEIEVKTKDFVDYFPKLVAAMDDPIADIAAYSVYAVMRAARNKGIKVMLNGIGADEIFWGYQWIIDAVKVTDASKVKDPKYFAYYDQNPDYQFSKQQTSSLYTKEFSRQLPPKHLESFYQLPPEDTPVQMIDLLSRSWMFSNAVALYDRMSMANSVELRAPFLDYRLIELVIGLNKADSNFHQQPVKQLLKDAVSKYLPKEVLDRPKQGFRPPVELWMAGVILRYFRLLPFGYLVRHKIIKRRALLSLFLITSHRKAARHVFFLYKLILLELWCRIYFEDTKPNQFSSKN